MDGSEFVNGQLRKVSVAPTSAILRCTFFLGAMVDGLLEKGLIEPSQTEFPWISRQVNGQVVNAAVEVKVYTVTPRGRLAVRSHPIGEVEAFVREHRTGTHR